MSDDSEGRLERRIFQELFASWPHSDCVEAAIMFPTLFPTGRGVFDEDRPHQMRFVEYRDGLLGLSDPRFRQNEEWKNWASAVADAIELRKRGEDVMISPATEEEQKIALEDTFRNAPIEQRMVDPARIRSWLLAMRQLNNPAFRHEQGKNIDELVEERIVEARQSEWSVIKECAICHRYECSEKHPGLSLSMCSKCRHVFYCGREHQKQDWPRHRKHCKRLAKTLKFDGSGDQKSSTKKKSDA